MRFTEHNETPVNRATSVFEWPAFNEISTSCRLSMPNILLPPPPGLQTGEAQGEFYLLGLLLDGSEFPECGGSEFPELTMWNVMRAERLTKDLFGSGSK